MSVDKAVLEMLKSEDKEIFNVGLQVCLENHPELYMIMTNSRALYEKKAGASIFDNLDKVPIKNYVEELESLLYHYVEIGQTVKYRGMTDSPMFMVTGKEIHRSLNAIVPNLHLIIECKYFNKSNQSFVSIRDRAECFEIIKK